MVMDHLGEEPTQQQSWILISRVITPKYLKVRPNIRVYAHPSNTLSRCRDVTVPVVVLVDRKRDAAMEQQKAT